MKDFNALINSVKVAESLTEEQIAERLGYNEGYISQTRSRGKVSPKFIAAIYREFRLADPKQRMKYTPITTTGPISAPITLDEKERLIIALQEQVKQLQDEVKFLRNLVSIPSEKRHS